MSSTSLPQSLIDELTANITASVYEQVNAELMPSSKNLSTTNGGSSTFVEVGYASTAFLICMSALVMIMTPGLGLFYSGLIRSKNALTIIMLCFLAYAVVAVQWVLLGFSLTFSETGSSFIGDFVYGGFRNVMWQSLLLTAPQVPVIVFALYQMQFATVTVAIIFGSVAERIRILPSIIFMFLWTTVIYDPTAYWTWAARGWIKNMSCLSTTSLDQTPCQIGGIDFAGGGPVHMASGAAALAFCIFLGHRKRVAHDEFKPHNMTNVFLGTALLWFGWFGFNSGSATSATARAGYAGVVTTVSASSGAIAWVLVDYVRTGKFSGLAFCSGAIAGLVGITPAAGYVPAWSSIIIGSVSAVCCSFSIRVKEYLGYDDSADAWGIHGVGGFVGAILTALFASQAIPALDGSFIPGGAFINGNWDLLKYNFLGAIAILAYSFVGTLILILMINYIPGLHFRVDEAEEVAGGDRCEMGETAYEFVPSFSPSMLGDMKTDATEKDLTIV